jgi:glycosyltransferase involved in cell wall biosynthesis
MSATAHHPARLVYFTALAPDDDPNPFMAAIWLKRQGRPFTFICRGSAEEFPSPYGSIPLESIPDGGAGVGRLLWHVRAAWALVRQRWIAPKAVFYLQRSESSAAAWLGLMFLSRGRLVYHTQDYLEPGQFPFWQFLERRLARRASFVISNEPNRARFMASSYQLRRPPLVVRTSLPSDWPLPVGADRWRAELSQRVQPADGPVRFILHHGAMTPLRCSDQVLDALALLPGRMVLVCTAMAETSASFRQWAPRIEARGLTSRVICLPRLSFSDLGALTEAADVGLLLYVDDGIGNFYQAPGRLAQFMRAGVPVVISKFPGLELLSLKYGTGRACLASDPQDVADAIAALADRSDEQKVSEAHRLRELALGPLAFDIDAARIEEVVDALVWNRGPLCS